MIDFILYQSITESLGKDGEVESVFKDLAGTKATVLEEAVAQVNKFIESSQPVCNEAKRCLQPIKTILKHQFAISED